MSIKKFKKKPVVIEAYQWRDGFNTCPFEPDNEDVTGMEFDGLTQLCDQCQFTLESHRIIYTLEGRMKACPGDWIIKGVKGELYPCKPEIFNQTYEEVRNES